MVARFIEWIKGSCDTQEELRLLSLPSAQLHRLVFAKYYTVERKRIRANNLDRWLHETETKEPDIDETIPNNEEELYAWFQWYEETHPKSRRALNPKYANNIMLAIPTRVGWEHETCS